MVAQHSLITCNKGFVMSMMMFSLIAYLIHLWRTGARLAKYLASLHPFHHLRVLSPAIRHLPTSEHLPAEHTVSPHITFTGEPGKVEDLKTKMRVLNRENLDLFYLGRTPLDRKLSPSIAGILVINDISCKAKVSNLHNILCPDQTVPGGQVPVDVVVPLQVGHAPAHLQAYVQQGAVVVVEGGLQPSQEGEQAAVLELQYV